MHRESLKLVTFIHYIRNKEHNAF